MAEIGFGPGSEEPVPRGLPPGDPDPEGLPFVFKTARYANHVLNTNYENATVYIRPDGTFVEEIVLTSEDYGITMERQMTPNGNVGDMSLVHVIDEGRGGVKEEHLTVSNDVVYLEGWHAGSAMNWFKKRRLLRELSTTTPRRPRELGPDGPFDPKLDPEELNPEQRHRGSEGS